jgi:DNA-binding response OmpR family regulator
MQLNRVLLAHSDSTVQELATRALSRIGVAVDISLDSADALSRVARETYTVVVLERDDAVIAAIAATYAGPRPVVIVTAERNEGLDAQIVSLVVPEPYDAHTLVGVILACVTPGSAPGLDAPPDDLANHL